MPWAIVMACLVACLLTACDRKSSAPAPTTSPAATTPRIVSLSPAISRTLVDLGLNARLVGRTPYCDSLDAAIPVVGDLQNVNFELLARLGPSHILVQPPAGGVDPHLQRVADERGWKIAAWHLDGVEDIRTMLREIPAAIFDETSPDRAEFERRSSALIRRIDTALAPPSQEMASQPAFRGRVLMVNAVNPVMAFGTGTYLDDVLRALRGSGEAPGALNVVQDRGWVRLSLEDVVRLAPEAIILVKPGADASDLQRDLGPLATIDVPAVKAQRFSLLSHPDAFMPSSGVIGVAGEMRGVLQRLGGGE